MSDSISKIENEETDKDNDTRTSRYICICLILIGDVKGSELKQKMDQLDISPSKQSEKDTSQSTLTEDEEKQLSLAIKESSVPLQYAQNVLRKRGICCYYFMVFNY